MKTSDVPDRHCEFCGAVIDRQRLEERRISPRDYAARRFCNVKCSTAARTAACRWGEGETAAIRTSIQEKGGAPDPPRWGVGATVVVELDRNRIIDCSEAWALCEIVDRDGVVQSYQVVERLENGRVTALSATYSPMLSVARRMYDKLVANGVLGSLHVQEIEKPVEYGYQITTSRARTTVWRGTW